MNAPGPSRAGLHCAVAAAATLVAVVPLFFPGLLAGRPSFAVQLVLSGLALALPIGAVAWCWATVELDRPRNERLALFVLLGGLTLYLVHMHVVTVDRGWYFRDRDNTAWQLEAQARVLALDPTFEAHPYRFLSFCVVRWLHFATGSFEAGRSVYRHTFTFLLLVTVHVLGRERFSRATSLLGTAIYVALTPVTYRYYAGQPTDPISHLSFAVAFLALERRQFPYLFVSILIGTMAKESVLALAGYYALFRRDDERHLQRSLVLCGSGGVLLVAIRLFVQGGRFRYEHVSGVGNDHPWRNLSDPLWPAQALFSVGLLLPFLVLGWRRAPALWRTLIPFLLVALFGSSLLFSWLREARNYVPATILLAHLAAAVVTGDEGREGRAA